MLRSSKRVHLYPPPPIVASGSQRSAVLHLIFSTRTEILYLRCQLEKRKWTDEAAEDPDVGLDWTDSNISMIASTSWNPTPAPASHHTTGVRLTFW